MKKIFLSLFILIGYITKAQDFQSSGAYVIMEAENFNLNGGWSVATSKAGYTGSGYIVHSGENFAGVDAGIDVISVQIKINTAGTYRVQWRNAITVGSSTTDNNDTWLRFPDADNFYANSPGQGSAIGASTVYPRGWNKTPLPNGETNKGWFKIYDNSLSWIWNTYTSDNDGHYIYVNFANAGVYHMEISNRSANHGIDRVVLWNTSTGNESTATNTGTATTPYTPSGSNGTGTVTITGELKNYHKTTLTFEGLWKDEKIATFRDNRFNVTFTSPTAVQYVVPGYFAADGNAANTGATEGNKWRVNFLPTEEGVWSYTTSFRTGTNVAASTNASAGSTAAPLNGLSGNFTITATDKIGKDFRGKGKLEYVDGTFLQFTNGEYFYKIGADSPEVFLEYSEFDNTFAPTRIYSTHISDWVSGDLVWKTTKGKGIVGVVNYLTSLDQSVHYFMPMNVYGDGGHTGTALGKGGEVSPFIGADALYRYDTSKLGQWEILFDEMMEKGMMAHFVLSEQENQSYFEIKEGGTMSNGRKIYYREMVARFGYLNAITWNIGEESGWTSTRKYGAAVTTAQQLEFAAYMDEIAYYKDNISIHDGPSNEARTSQIFNNLTGVNSFTGIAYQGIYDEAESGGYSDGIGTYDRLTYFRTLAINASKPWVISYDEPWAGGLLDTQTEYDKWRKQSLWLSIMAGASGIELYYGSSNDLSQQDYRQFSTLWNYQKYARDFFYNHNIPLWELTPDKTIVNSDNYALKDSGKRYIIYAPNGGTPTLTTGDAITYNVKWYNPRGGGLLENGSITSITGGTNVSLGTAPNTTTSDWVIYVNNPLSPTTGMNGDTSEPEPEPEPEPTGIGGIFKINGDKVNIFNNGAKVSLGSIGIPEILPIITNVVISEVTTTSARVTWYLDDECRGFINYGTDTNYGNNTTIEYNYLSAHSQVISGLTPNTLYNFEINGTNINGKSVALINRTFITLANPIEEGAYFVTTTGSSSNDGLTENTAWTLIHAFNTALPGDVVYVKAGNYGGQIINSVRSGTIGNPIKFIGYTNTPGDINATIGSTYTYTDWINNGSDLPDNIMPHLELNPVNNLPTSGQDAFNINHEYIEIHNFFISEYQIGIDIRAHNVTVNNVFGDQFGAWDSGMACWNATDDGCSDNANGNPHRSGYGMYILGANNATVTNTTFIDAGFVTYFIVGSDNGTYTNVTGIAENTGNGADYIFDLYNSDNNTLDNILARRTYGGSLGHRSRAITTQGPSGSHSNTITNMVTENLRIQSEYSDGNTYTDVVMRTINGGSGENDGSIQIGNDSNNSIFKNFSMTGAGGIQFLGYETGDGGPTVTTAGANNYFINFKMKNLTNIGGNAIVSFHRLGNTGVGSGPNYIIGLTADSFPRVINANRNGIINFYNSSFSNGVYSSIDTFYSGWPDFTGSYTANYTNSNFYGNAFATPSGTNITTGNPLLDSNLIPQAGSALLTAGMDASTLNAAASTDFIGTTRTVPYSIGAHEEITDTAWVSECITCPNAAVVANAGNSYTPTSAADMANVANAGKTAYLTNTFDLTGTTLAANQILVPNGGAITGVSINLNGARFVINGNRGFAASARFTSIYNECLTPELFGAASLSNDKTAIEAMIINSNYGKSAAGATYVVSSQTVITTSQRVFNWIGNGSKISSTYEPPGNYDLLYEFDGLGLNICDLEIDGNDITDSGIQMLNAPSLYLEDFHLHNFYGDGITERAIGIAFYYDSNVTNSIRVYNSTFNNFETLDDDIIGNGNGVTRGFFLVMRDTSIDTGIIEFEGCEFYSNYAEGEGIHIYPESGDEMDHEILVKINDCDFWDNSRRDIKAQSGGLQVTNSRFTKILSTSDWGDDTTTSIGVALGDVVSATQYHRNAIIRGNTFNAAMGDTEPKSSYVSLSNVSGGIIENNIFNRPKAGPYANVSYQNKVENTVIRNNIFMNGGIQASDNIDDYGRLTVENNTFTYNEYWIGYYNTLINPGGTPYTIRNLTFQNNDVTINFNQSYSATWFKGIVGTRPSWNTTYDDILITNNNIIYQGIYKTGVPFLFTDYNFGSSNTISNHSVIGITATGAFEIGGTAGFTNINNTDGSGNPLTIE